MTAHANYSLRDEIRDYWSDRAETFDLQVGHEIFSEQERAAWHALISRHLGPGAGRAALDLACGTGVISHLMHDLGFAVTGLDWSEAMLAKARAKAQNRGADIRFIVRDAERTLEDKASYDVIVTRHLVWTLLDPEAAFAEWFSLLKPGGRLLVIDGDFVSRNWAMRLREIWEKLTAGKSRAPDNDGAAMARRHQNILARVYFSEGAQAEEIVRLLAEAGFDQPVLDWKLGAIHRAQARQMSWPKALERATQLRFAICATKPQ
ncbi:MAG: class I SAM-dependent methyltransferase [Mesorhizobium sp.]|uniref:class I SAM-dependent methyltransferase n=1 Tax=Mesorhizobium sp. TaxID=1871066 RepID=UPI000FE988A6|nr:class I SAM-dependent methyltransferase [Mesorhizobium sp.]RWH84700.1 MAG: class I SAM-dependent methyltransferase [Mesorhizobium sp.]RWH87089.1 MAG: class I SAM-dependent methyltransferase [Mesorhizobium sp.]RWH93372.1 MAG: class I SAM-dependent methyltransferase [Mesorhizobium sp.]RWI03169.1 MAG: class I SAM-dependent methyltransferase [Mesorhizobium sp.]RWI05678.1 MAG: class I SAM-dependent methyltransferase [Mesorhizobium sp.]